MIAAKYIVKVHTKIPPPPPLPSTPVDQEQGTAQAHDVMKQRMANMVAPVIVQSCAGRIHVHALDLAKQ